MEKTQLIKNGQFLFNGLKIVAMTLLLVFLYACSGSNGGTNSVAGDPGNNQGPPPLPAVLFLSDRDNGVGQDELWVVYTDGQGPFVLSEPLTNNGEVIEFKMDLFGREKLAYVTTDTADNKQALWTVNIDGSDSALEAEFTDPNGEGIFTEWHWSPDGCCIAYRADMDGDTFYELYVVEGSGAAPLLVSANNDVEEGFQWSPDNMNLAFRAADVDGVVQLWVVDRDGSDLIDVSEVVDTDADAATIFEGVRTFAFQHTDPWPNAVRLAFVGYNNNGVPPAGEYELYIVEIDGISAKDQLSTLAGTENDVLDFKWHPKDTFIAYVADEEDANNEELWSVSLEGGFSTYQISDLTNNQNQKVEEFQWAPRGLMIAYLADQDTTGVMELFVADQEGNGNWKINDGGIVKQGFQWAPGDPNSLLKNDYIAYRVGNELRVRDFLVADSEILIDDNVTDSDFYGWAPGVTTRIAFTADDELWTTPWSGGAATKVSDVAPNDGDVETAQWCLDASGLIYLANDQADGADALYATQPDQPLGGKLSGTVVAGSQGVTDFSPILINQ